MITTDVIMASPDPHAPTAAPRWWPWLHTPLKVDGHAGERVPAEKSILAPGGRGPLCRVVLDQSLSSELRAEPQCAYLLQLLRSSHLTTLLYDEDRLVIPTNLDETISPDQLGSCIVALPSDYTEAESRCWAENKTIRCGYFWQKDSRYGLMDAIPIPNGYLDLPFPRLQMKSDLELVLSAEAVGAHILITERESLFSIPIAFERKIVLLRPDDALPLIGLCLRNRGDFPVYADDVYKRGLGPYFGYFVAGCALVPNLVRLSKLCSVMSDGQRESEWSELGAAVPRRVTQILQSRDRLLQTLALSQDQVTAEAVASEFESISLWMLGAFDALALIFQRAFGLRGVPPSSIGFQKAKWRKALLAAAPELDVLLKSTSTGVNFLSVLSLTRNGIHAVSVSSILSRRNRLPDDVIIRLWPRELNNFDRALESVAETKVWGSTWMPMNGRFFYPGMFVETLVGFGLPFLDALIEAAPFERFWNGDLDKSLPDFPGDAFGIHDQRSRDRMRWQLGILTQTFDDWVASQGSA